MMKLQRIYITLVALILAFAGCDKLINDQNNDNGIESKVYLSVSVLSAQPNGALRAADQNPSINTDASLYEDRVHSLAMFIFDSGTGKLIGSYKGNNLGSGEATHAFTVEVTPGERDFYFVANMPEVGLEGITDRDAMDTYLANADRELDPALYLGATENKGFPMARVYKNQQITEGGTVYQPKPFLPVMGNDEVSTVVVSGSGLERKYVDLIRVVAKLEVILDASSAENVDKIYFRNANQNFRLVEFETAPVAYFNSTESNTTLKKIENTNTYLYYMPEARITGKAWDASSDANNEPVNFFTIVTTDNKQFDIPIISNEASITENYLEKATSTFAGFAPNYTIKRNDHYKFEVSLKKNIEILYTINPWEKVKRQLYMGYGYNVEVDENGNVTISNTFEACPPHEIELKAFGDAIFDGDVKEIKFNNADPKGVAEYKLATVPEKGKYLEVYYNGELVKTFSK